MKQNIVFFGSGAFTVPVIQKLIPHGLDLVITNDKNPNSQLTLFCHNNNITVLVCSSSSDLINHLPSPINHSIAILASYGAIVPDKIIETFPNGIINIHPSLLPKYKGPTPIPTAILNGEAVTGVTLIKLDNKVDHGPILSQRPYSLQGNETSKDLLSILFEIGADMVEEQIVKLENGERLVETPQDHSQESWSHKIEKKDGMIDINQLNAKPYTLNAMIRAYFPWPGVWFVSRIKDQELRIKLLPEGKIQIEGKKPMFYKDFINGFGEEGRSLLEKLSLI